MVLTCPNYTMIIDLEPRKSSFCVSPFCVGCPGPADSVVASPENMNELYAKVGEVTALKSESASRLGGLSMLLLCELPDSC